MSAGAGPNGILVRLAIGALTARNESRNLRLSPSR